jgi:LysR family glycine cleavage system transcriptional activator
VLQAALAGQGAALVDKTLAADEIASGRLVRLFDREIPFGAYWLVARSFRRLSPAAAAFADWLTARCRARVAAVMSAAD